jgi:glycosyltransferase involved in cell wall biosynthesis
MNHNPNVTVMPTVINPKVYPPKETYQKEEDRFVVGWIGLKYNFPYLDAVGAWLPEGAVLRVISSAKPSLPGVPLEFLPWSEASEARQIAEFDVGIMPLPDDEWARGKCALKILQYMAAGVPVVASPVGINPDIIQDGKNGFLAASNEDWSERLNRLALSDSLRERIGKAGLETVTLSYTVEQGLKKLVQIYTEL